MPFTLIHWIPALIANVFVKRINTLAILLGSTLIDIEPAYKMISGILPHHSVVSHSLIGLITIAVPAALLAILIERVVYKRKVIFFTAYLSAALGVFLHLLLDIPIHYDIPIFYPIYTGFKTFYDPYLTSIIIAILLVIFVIIAFYKKKELKGIVERYVPF